MTTTFMTLHIAAYTESLAAADVRTTEWFLARMAVGVDAQARRTGEGLMACSADISVVVKGIWRGVRRWEVVVMLLPGGRCHGCRWWWRRCRELVMMVL
jgi:hypothetical protein